MIENKKWYAVYTRPRFEKKVAEILTRKRIENYCPFNKVVRKGGERRKIALEPLFTSLVFVRVTESEMSLIKEVNGVINPAYWLGKLAIIRDSEIDSIRRFLSEHVNVQLEKSPIMVDDRVRVLDGPLMEVEGETLTVIENTAKVLLSSLGYMMCAEIETANVEVIVRTIVPSESQVLYPKYAIK